MSIEIGSLYHLSTHSKNDLFIVLEYQLATKIKVGGMDSVYQVYQIKGLTIFGETFEYICREDILTKVA